ncbi:MAG: imidazoleglycerol-phosphate dehydratase HisB [Rubricoccaceae bacterium]
MSPPLPPRRASIERRTAETSVAVEIDLDPDAPSYENRTGVGFLDHMLDLFARHGGLRLRVKAQGDLYVDDHHTVEDVGIVLGQALREALGDKSFVARYGHAYVPMDEALARSVIDLSGRAFLVFDGTFARERVGDLSTELVRHFWWSIAEHAALTLHISILAGDNDHHKIEAVFKSAGRALRNAVARDASGDRTPSTKEAL